MLYPGDEALGVDLAVEQSRPLLSLRVPEADLPAVPPVDTALNGGPLKSSSLRRRPVRLGHRRSGAVPCRDPQEGYATPTTSCRGEEAARTDASRQIEPPDTAALDVFDPVSTSTLVSHLPRPRRRPVSVAASRRGTLPSISGMVSSVWRSPQSSHSKRRCNSRLHGESSVVDQGTLPSAAMVPFSRP